MRILTFATLATALVITMGAIAQEETTQLGWPRTVFLPDYEIQVFRPSLEAKDGSILTARSAVSIRKEGFEQVLGTVRYGASFNIDHGANMATIENVAVSDIQFEDRPDHQAELTGILFREFPASDLSLTLGELRDLLEQLEGGPASSQLFRHEEVVIIYRDHPALLVTVDGEPIFEGDSTERLVNTPFFLTFDFDRFTYFLYAGSGWFESLELTRGWRRSSDIPYDTLRLATELFGDEEQVIIAAAEPAEVVVVFEPTELIVTRGPPELSALGVANLSYVTNTSNDLLLDRATGDFYTLASGRWYRSKRLQGPWQHVVPQDLPTRFREIPVGSPMNHIRASVPGTPESQEAIAKALIPEVLEVYEDQQVEDISYDGDPVFDPVEGVPDLRYAVNTDAAVFHYRGQFYRCAYGAWWISPRAVGTWRVCVRPPPALYRVPPSCPLYPCRFVRVQGRRGAAVVFGYSDGYLGSYVYRGTIIFGTGYRYPRWYRRVYYARPMTWGFGGRYDVTAAGWGFKVGYFSGTVWQASPLLRRGGWWGVAGYRRVTVVFVGGRRRFEFARRATLPAATGASRLVSTRRVQARAAVLRRPGIGRSLHSRLHRGHRRRGHYLRR